MRRWLKKANTRGSLVFFIVVAVLFPGLAAFLLDWLHRDYFTSLDPLVWGLLLAAAVILVALLFIRAVLIVAENLQQETGRRVRELAALNDLSQTLDQYHNLAALLKPAMEKLLEISSSDAAELYLENEQHHELAHMLHVGTMEKVFTAEVQQDMVQRLSSGGRRAREQVQVGDAAVLPGGSLPALENAGIRAAALIPMKSPGGTSGIICLFSRGRDAFQADAPAFLLRMGARIALAIEKARLYEKVQAVAVMEERERISAELHDGLAQVLGYVITKSQATRQLLRRITEANDYLVELENVAQEVYTDTREAILGLRTAVSGSGSLVSAIREYAQRFNQMHDIKTELVTGDKLIPSLPPQVELQVIRIVQEALSNIRKHARATRAIIRVNVLDDAVKITIEDDGKGFDVNGPERNDWTRFGLRNMKERAESINADLSIDSRVDRGTTVILNVPLSAGPETEKKGEDGAGTDR
jgi:signal transduction histidine kinase